MPLERRPLFAKRGTGRCLTQAWRFEAEEHAIVDALRPLRGPGAETRHCPNAVDLIGLKTGSGTSRFRVGIVNSCRRAFLKGRMYCVCGYHISRRPSTRILLSTAARQRGKIFRDGSEVFRCVASCFACLPFAPWIRGVFCCPAFWLTTFAPSPSSRDANVCRLHAVLDMLPRVLYHSNMSLVLV